MAISHKQQRQLAFAGQSAYGTVAPFQTSGTRSWNQLLVIDENKVERDTGKGNNQNWSTGSDFPTLSWLKNHTAKVSRQMPLNAREIGYFLRFMMGAPTTTTVETGIYSHAFVPVSPASTRQLKAFSFAERHKTGSDTHDNIWRDMVVESMSIGGDNTADITKYDMEWYSSGKRITPSGLVIAPTSSYNTNAFVSASPYLYNQMLSISIDGEVYGCDMESWKWDYKNNHDLTGAYRAACGNFQIADNNLSGIVATQMLFGSRSSQFSVTLQDQNIAPWWANYVELNQQIGVQFALVGPTLGVGHNYSLTIGTTNADFTSVTRGYNGAGFDTVTLNWDAFAVSATDYSLAVTLVNDVASYA